MQNFGKCLKKLFFIWKSEKGNCTDRQSLKLNRRDSKNVRGSLLACWTARGYLVNVIWTPLIYMANNLWNTLDKTFITCFAGIIILVSSQTKNHYHDGPSFLISLYPYHLNSLCGLHFYVLLGLIMNDPFLSVLKTKVKKLFIPYLFLQDLNRFLFCLIRALSIHLSGLLFWIFPFNLPSVRLFLFFFQVALRSRMLLPLGHLTSSAAIKDKYNKNGWFSQTLPHLDWLNDMMEGRLFSQFIVMQFCLSDEDLDDSRFNNGKRRNSFSMMEFSTKTVELEIVEKSFFPEITDDSSETTSHCLSASRVMRTPKIAYFQFQISLFSINYQLIVIQTERLFPL